MSVLRNYPMKQSYRISLQEITILLPGRRFISLELMGMKCLLSVLMWPAFTLSVVDMLAARRPSTDMESP